MMKPAGTFQADEPPRSPRPGRSFVGKLLLHAACLVAAVVAFAAHDHFALHGQSSQALASLIIAAGLGLVPVRALVRELLAIEGKVLHVFHGIAGIAIVALGLGGVVSGGPLLTHGALAPFAIMGAAQAIMHQDHPRSREEAEALRSFATSLPRVREFTTSSDLTSPANVGRAVSVLTDLIAKAEKLGETELRADPGFQSALRRATTRFGLSLGLDAADQAITRLATSPAGVSAVPELRRRVAAARRVVERSALEAPRPPR